MLHCARLITDMVRTPPLRISYCMVLSPKLPEWPVERSHMVCVSLVFCNAKLGVEVFQDLATRAQGLKFSTADL